MHQQVECVNNCTLCPHCIYVFCICLRTNSDLCHLQHKLIVFITEMKSVYSAVRTGSLNEAVCAPSFKGLYSRCDIRIKYPETESRLSDERSCVVLSKFYLLHSRNLGKRQSHGEEFSIYYTACQMHMPPFFLPEFICNYMLCNIQISAMVWS
jgi:hypothetical protein